MILLFPTEMEAAPLRKLRPDLDIRICGVGAVECAVTVAHILRTEQEPIVLCGIAGAYNHALQKGDVVSVAKERYCHLSSGYNASYLATIDIEGLPRVVSNTVAQCGAEASGAEVENMEGAALFALCAEAGVRCGEIRSISNYVGEERSEWNIELAIEMLATYLAKNL